MPGHNADDSFVAWAKTLYDNQAKWADRPTMNLDYDGIRRYVLIFIVIDLVILL